MQPLLFPIDTMYSPIQYQSLVNEFLANKPYLREPKKLYEPVQYELGLGGKRIRPVLMLMAYHMLRENVESILPVAIGLETYHNYTLVHDDIMDNADMRRGKPTVHVKWNQTTALLCSEIMVLHAYEGMMQSCPEARDEVLKVFTQTAVEISEGQQYDIEFEDRDDVTVPEYMEMIRLKTSVLLACALKLGAIQAGATSKDCELIYSFGEKFGLAFQLQDDYLDVYGDAATFGKNIGGDILCNKKTFMLLSALERASGDLKAELQGWISAEDPDPQEKVAAVTAIYNELDIKALCENQIKSYYDEAKALLDEMSFPEEKKQVLWDYVASMINRDF